MLILPPPQSEKMQIQVVENRDQELMYKLIKLKPEKMRESIQRLIAEYEPQIQSLEIYTKMAKFVSHSSDHSQNFVKNSLSCFRLKDFTCPFLEMFQIITFALYRQQTVDSEAKTNLQKPNQPMTNQLPKDPEPHKSEKEQPSLACIDPNQGISYTEISQDPQAECFAQYYPNQVAHSVSANLPQSQVNLLKSSQVFVPSQQHSSTDSIYSWNICQFQEQIKFLVRKNVKLIREFVIPALANLQQKQKGYKLLSYLRDIINRTQKYSQLKQKKALRPFDQANALGCFQQLMKKVFEPELFFYVLEYYVYFRTDAELFYYINDKIQDSLYKQDLAQNERYHRMKSPHWYKIGVYQISREAIGKAYYYFTMGYNLHKLDNLCVGVARSLEKMKEIDKAEAMFVKLLEKAKAGCAQTDKWYISSKEQQKSRIMEWRRLELNCRIRLSQIKMQQRKHCQADLLINSAYSLLMVIIRDQELWALGLASSPQQTQHDEKIVQRELDFIKELNQLAEETQKQSPHFQSDTKLIEQITIIKAYNQYHAEDYESARQYFQYEYNKPKESGEVIELVIGLAKVYFKLKKQENCNIFVQKMIDQLKDNVARIDPLKNYVGFLKQLQQQPQMFSQKTNQGINTLLVKATEHLKQRTKSEIQFAELLIKKNQCKTALLILNYVTKDLKDYIGENNKMYSLFQQCNINQINELFRSKKYNSLEVVEEIYDILELYGKLKEYNLLLGQAYAQFGSKKALPLLKSGLQIKPNHLALQTYLKILAKCKDQSKDVHLWIQSLKFTQPSQSIIENVQIQLGNIYKNNCDYELARNCYEKAIQTGRAIRTDRAIQTDRISEEVVTSLLQCYQELHKQSKDPKLITKMLELATFEATFESKKVQQNRQYQQFLLSKVHYALFQQTKVNLESISIQELSESKKKIMKTLSRMLKLKPNYEQYLQLANLSLQVGDTSELGNCLVGLILNLRYGQLPQLFQKICDYHKVPMNEVQTDRIIYQYIGENKAITKQKLLCFYYCLGHYRKAIDLFVKIIEEIRSSQRKRLQRIIGLSNSLISLKETETFISTLLLAILDQEKTKGRGSFRNIVENKLAKIHKVTDIDGWTTNLFDAIAPLSAENKAYLFGFWKEEFQLLREGSNKESQTQQEEMLQN